MQKINYNRHSFHLVDPSPWPSLAGISALCLTVGGVLYMHGYCAARCLWELGLATLLIVLYSWWLDITRESTLEGQHTQTVQTGLRLGVILFIVSEIMFFFAFFWAFFHSSFNPSPALGGVWPPVFLVTLNAWEIPLLNTVLLLSSGASVTWAHHALTLGSKKDVFIAINLTVLLAIIFTSLQGFEYATAPFTISDSVYGSSFYMATGFHGFHVIIGTLFLIVCSIRQNFNSFTNNHHFGFEAAAWYWHFVDIVWLFLFITIYWWGN